MTVLESIRKRREVTHFAPMPIPREHVRALVEAGYYSVTGNNLPSREFIVVEERATLEALSHTTPFVGWLAEAPLCIAIVGSPTVSKYWLQDATIATSNIWLTATELGLGAAWGAIHHSEDAEECARRERLVRNILKIPEGLRPVSLLGVGFAAKQPGAKGMVELSQVLHVGEFGNRVGKLSEL